MKNLTDSVNEALNLRDIANKARNKVQQVGRGVGQRISNLTKSTRRVADRVFKWGKADIEQYGDIFLAKHNGEFLKTMLPLNMDMLYKQGKLSENITIISSKASSAITGCKSGVNNILKISPSPKDYFNSFISKLKSFNLQKLKNIFKRNKVSESLEYDSYDRLDEKLTLQYKGGDVPDVDYDELQLLIKTSMATKVPLLIFGAPGIGKSTIVKQIVTSLRAENNKEFRWIDLRATGLRKDDFLLPSYVKDEMDNITRSTDLPKDWLPVYKVTGNKEDDKISSDKCEQGVIFIDEFSQLDPEVKGFLLEFVLAGTIPGGYKMGDNWTCIACSNRIQDQLDANDMKVVERDRWQAVNYVPGCNDWLKFAKTQNWYNDIIMDWLSEPINQKYFYYDTDENTGEIGIATPRSWERACTTLNALCTEYGVDHILGLDTVLVEKILCANVGPDVARAFTTYMTLAKEIDLKALKAMLVDTADLDNTDPSVIKPKNKYIKKALPKNIRNQNDVRADILHMIRSFIMMFMRTNSNSGLVDMTKEKECVERDNIKFNGKGFTYTEWFNLTNYIIELGSESFYATMIKGLQKEYGKEFLISVFYTDFDLYIDNQLSIPTQRLIDKFGDLESSGLDLS